MGTTLNFKITIEPRRYNRLPSSEQIENFWQELREIAENVTENNDETIDSRGRKAINISAKWWDEHSTQLKELSKKYSLIRINVDISADEQEYYCKEIFIDGRFAWFEGCVVYPGYLEFDENFTKFE